MQRAVPAHLGTISRELVAGPPIMHVRCAAPAHLGTISRELAAGPLITHVRRAAPAHLGTISRELVAGPQIMHVQGAVPVPRGLIDLVDVVGRQTQCVRRAAHVESASLCQPRVLLLPMHNAAPVPRVNTKARVVIPGRHVQPVSNAQQDNTKLLHVRRLRTPGVPTVT